jgi:hypothetical protein
MAEVFGDHEIFWNCGIDLCLDGNFLFTLCDILLHKNGKQPRDFVEYLKACVASPLLMKTVHFKDGHDIRDMGHLEEGLGKPRCLNTDDLLLVATLMVTMPGVPAFFNGEIEAVLGYPYVRGAVVPINWGNVDFRMADRYLDIVSLSKLPVFREGAASFIESSHPNICAFSRSYRRQNVIVAANLGDCPDPLSDKNWAHLNLKGTNLPPAGDWVLRNMVIDRSLGPAVFDEGKLLVALKPRQAQVLEVVKK